MIYPADKEHCAPCSQQQPARHGYVGVLSVAQLGSLGSQAPLLTELAQCESPLPSSAVVCFSLLSKQ